MTRKMLVVFLFLFLIPGIALADNATDTNYTFGECTNCTVVSGNVVDIVWLPNWELDLPNTHCEFSPHDDVELNKSYYYLSCKIDYNISKDTPTACLPLQLLTDLDVESIQDDREALALYKGRYELFLWLFIVTFGLLIIYLAYENWWTQRVHDPFGGDVSIPDQEGKNFFQQLKDGVTNMKTELVKTKKELEKEKQKPKSQPIIPKDIKEEEEYNADDYVELEEVVEEKNKRNDK